jgi:hypothetical protein
MQRVGKTAFLERDARPHSVGGTGSIQIDHFNLLVIRF